MLRPEEVEARLRQGLADLQHVAVEDLTGTGDHFHATVVCGGFAGKSRLERQRMVYRALGDWMAGPIHALALDTLEPQHVAGESK